MTEQTTDGAVDTLEAFKARHFEYMREVVGMSRNGLEQRSIATDHARQDVGMGATTPVQESSTAAVPLK